MDKPFSQSFQIDYKNQQKKIDILRYLAKRIDATHEPVLTRPYWRLFWANKKGKRFLNGDQALELGPEYITVVPPNLEIVHEFYEDFDVFNMNVDIEKPFHAYPEIFQIPVGDETLEVIKAILKDPYRSDFCRQAQLQGIVLKMLSHLDPEFFKLSTKNKKVAEVIQYMEQHLHEYLNNDVLASQCQMSTNSFIRLFSKETRISPQEYLRNIRLDMAANLLLKTKLSIHEICQKCGFSERNYFSRVFSKRFKMGPMSYRKVETH